MTPAQETSVAMVARLTQELAEAHALIDAQNGALAAQDAETFAPPSELLLALTPQQRNFVGILTRASYPNCIPKGVIADMLPSRDHAVERTCDKIVDVLAARVRNRLGAESIETVWGVGYRLGPDLRAALIQQKEAA